MRLIFLLLLLFSNTGFSQLSAPQCPKIIKNPGGSPVVIEDVGEITIGAGSSITIDPVLDKFYRRSQDLDDFIVAGTLVVNDGTSDLASTIGREYIQSCSLKLDIRENNVSITKPTLIVDFTGGVNVTDQGNGKAEVDILDNGSGTEYQFWNDGNTYSTTSNNWVTIFDTDDVGDEIVTANGTYWLFVTSEQTNTDSDKDTGWRVRFNDTTLADQRQGPVDDDLYMPRSTQYIITLDGTDRIRVDHGQTDQGGTARTRRIRVIIKRVGS